VNQGLALCELSHNSYLAAAHLEARLPDKYVSVCPATLVIEPAQQVSSQALSLLASF
jgi:hypothetical protein